MSLSVVALTLHAVALSHGSLVLVQPVIVTGVVFAVLIRAALDHGWPSRAEVAWAAATWAGLATFLVGTGAPSRAVHPPAHAGPAITVLLVLAATGALLARCRPAGSTGKGLWLGAVSGVLFGLVAVLLKLVLAAVATGPVSAVSGWPLWVMVACGICAVLVNQRAYQSSRLSVSMPLLNIIDVLVALVLAAVVFGETPRLGGLALLVQAAGLMAMGLGVFRLARLEDRDLERELQRFADATGFTIPSSGPAYVPGMRCVVVVPTYNEAATITLLLDGLLDVTAGWSDDGRVDVLVVDDNSPDGTGSIVQACDEFGDRVRLLSRRSKEGLGAAYRAGFAAAVEAGYDLVVQMDADGSHPVTAVPAMLDLLSTHDVVIGSRYVPGGATRNWPASRRALSWAANTYARGVLRLRTRDVTAGFRAWRADALARAGVLATTSEGYGFQVESTWRAERASLRIAEHPITFTDRTAGASKMSAAVAREALLRVLRWRIGELLHAQAGALGSAPRPSAVL
jgi:dolichol-phosphate mannosyltransferase